MNYYDVTYEQAKNTEEAKLWTINAKSGFQPVYEGDPIGISHKTENDARVFIWSCIAHNMPEVKQARQDEINRLYRDFDLC